MEVVLRVAQRHHGDASHARILVLRRQGGTEGLCRPGTPPYEHKQLHYRKYGLSLTSGKYISHNIPCVPANSALCLMIFPSTSSRLVTDVDMLMRICSDCSCRIKGLARFFHTPQICKSAHAGELQCPRLNFSWLHTWQTHIQTDQNAHLLKASKHPSSREHGEEMQPCFGTS